MKLLACAGQLTPHRGAHHKLKCNRHCMCLMTHDYLAHYNNMSSVYGALHNLETPEGCHAAHGQLTNLYAL